MSQTRVHTHETAWLPTDTLQNICEQDTKEEAEVGGDMKPACLSRLIIKFSKVTRLQRIGVSLHYSVLQKPA
jgi:hypothetical protein